MITIQYLTKALDCTEQEAHEVAQKLDAAPETRLNADARVSAWQAKHGDQAPPFAAEALQSIRSSQRRAQAKQLQQLEDKGVLACPDGQPDGLAPTEKGKPRCPFCRKAGRAAVDLEQAIANQAPTTLHAVS